MDKIYRNRNMKKDIEYILLIVLRYYPTKYRNLSKPDSSSLEMV